MVSQIIIWAYAEMTLRDWMSVPGLRPGLWRCVLFEDSTLTSHPLSNLVNYVYIDAKHDIFYVLLLHIVLTGTIISRLILLRCRKT